MTGPNTAIDLRILGVARRLPLAPMRDLFPVMWAGFWLNAATGVALVIAYPTKALTNPLFYGKLALVALAVLVLRAIRLEVFGGSGSDDEPLSVKARRLAIASLLLWLATIFAGRFLAYTYSRLMTWQL